MRLAFYSLMGSFSGSATLDSSKAAFGAWFTVGTPRLE